MMDEEADKIVQIADPDGYYDYKSVLIGAKAGYQAAMEEAGEKILELGKRGECMTKDFHDFMVWLNKQVKKEGACQ